MEKNVYQTPETCVIKMESYTLLAGSGEIGGGKGTEITADGYELDDWSNGDER